MRLDRLPDQAVRDAIDVRVLTAVRRLGCCYCVEIAVELGSWQVKISRVRSSLRRLERSGALEVEKRRARGSTSALRRYYWINRTPGGSGTAQVPGTTSETADTRPDSLVPAP